MGKNELAMVTYFHQKGAIGITLRLQANLQHVGAGTLDIPAIYDRKAIFFEMYKTRCAKRYRYRRNAHKTKAKSQLGIFGSRIFKQ